MGTHPLSYCTPINLLIRAHPVEENKIRAEHHGWFAHDPSRMFHSFIDRLCFQLQHVLERSVG
jgi:hypothetical protein